MCPGYSVNRKFYGIHQLLIVLFMFPWLKQAFNLETKSALNGLGNGDDDRNHPIRPVSSSLDSALQGAESPELQLIKIKRFFSTESRPRSNSSLFRINANTIIRTQDSRTNGAKYLNETEQPSNADCLNWCLQTKQCNLAVYEEKNQGSCYLFDCGPADDFKCKFTKHNFYSSSILAINRESLESKAQFQQQHENDLVSLRTSGPSINRTLSNGNNKSQTNLTAKQTSREADKLSTPKCQQYQFQCKNGSECIAIYNLCDGIKQCPDGSDEAPELHCPDPSNQISQLLAVNSMRPTGEPTNKDSADSKPLANQLVTPDFNYKKLPEIIDLTHKLDKAPNRANPFQSADQKNGIPNVKPWPSILNLDASGYPITHWNDYYNAYFGALNNLNNPQNAMSQPANQNGNPNPNPNSNQNNANGNPNGQPALNSKDFNALLWQMMDPNQQKSGGQSGPSLFDSLASNIQQQQFLQSLFNKQFSNWLDNSNKNTAALSYLNYLNSKQRQAKQPSAGGQPDRSTNPTNQAGPAIDQIKSNAFNNLNSDPDSRLSDLNNPGNPGSRKSSIDAISNPINKLDKGANVASIGKPSVEAASSTLASVPASNLNKARYVSYDFKQPFVQYNGRDDYYPDENEQDNNSAVIALVLGLFITILLIVIVGYRMSSIKKRIQRRGGRTLAHDADYLVNGMYL